MNISFSAFNLTLNKLYAYIYFQYEMDILNFTLNFELVIILSYSCIKYYIISV